MDNLITQGFVLIDVDVVALNNAGKDIQSNFDNAVGTKRIFKEGKGYVYVSGQAWRYWWRDTLEKICNWELSPVVRESKVAFTAANPVKYPDDDIFGYMKAAKEEVTDEKGKTKKENVTVTRVSPLKNSVLVSVGAVRIAENWSSMARQEGDSVPYSKQEYSAVMKGMFSLHLNQVGTFSDYNKTGYKNLTAGLKKEALENGSEEIEDLYLKDAKNNPHTLVRLPREVRLQRATETILALKNISGGAMQTNNMGDVTPKFIVLCTFNSGNHPFSHIASAEGKDNNVVNLSVKALKEVLTDYAGNIRGNVYIGRRSGFMDELDAELKELEQELPHVKVLTINQAIDAYAEQLKSQL